MRADAGQPAGTVKLSQEVFCRLVHEEQLELLSLVLGIDKLHPAAEELLQALQIDVKWPGERRAGFIVCDHRGLPSESRRGESGFSEEADVLGHIEAQVRLMD